MVLPVSYTHLDVYKRQVLDDAVKGRPGPVGLVRGHDVVVRHEDGGGLAGLALPGEEQAAAAYALRRAALVQKREALAQQGAEFFKQMCIRDRRSIEA